MRKAKPTKDRLQSEKLDSNVKHRCGTEPSVALMQSFAERRSFCTQSDSWNKRPSKVEVDVPFMLTANYTNQFLPPIFDSHSSNDKTTTIRHWLRNWAANAELKSFSSVLLLPLHPLLSFLESYRTFLWLYHRNLVGNSSYQTLSKVRFEWMTSEEKTATK